MTEKEEYKILKNKLIKSIEDNYLKDFHKEIKIFQIIMVGYNASKYKSLQVFKKYGWKLFSPIIGRWRMNCLFKYKISSKCNIYINLDKNLKTGILESNPNMVWAKYMKIHVEQTDEIFRLVDQINKLECYNPFLVFRLGNVSQKIIVEPTIDGEYILTISDSQN